MSDYRVKVTIRNDRLLRAIERAGFVAGQKLADAAGISYATLHALVALKLSAVDKDGELRPPVEKLCVFLSVMPSEVFTESAMYHKLETNSVELSMDEASAMQMLCPSSMIEQEQLSAAVELMLGSLPPRRRKVIELRMGIGCRPHTLKEAGVVLGVTPERVRSLESDALRKLRHRSIADPVRALMQ